MIKNYNMEMLRKKKRRKKFEIIYSSDGRRWTNANEKKVLKFKKKLKNNYADFN